MVAKCYWKKLFVLILRSLYLVSSYSVRVFITAWVKYACVCTQSFKEHKDHNKNIKIIFDFSSFVYFFVFSCNSWNMVRKDHSCLRQTLDVHLFQHVTHHISQ